MLDLCNRNKVSFNGTVKVIRNERYLRVERNGCIKVASRGLSLSKIYCKPAHTVPIQILRFVNVVSRFSLSIH